MASTCLECVIITSHPSDIPLSETAIDRHHTQIRLTIIKTINTAKIKKSEIIANNSLSPSHFLKRCANPASPRYRPPDIAAAKRNSCRKKDIRPIVPKLMLASPISRTIGKLLSSFSLKISFAVNAGLQNCFSPAVNKRSPMPEKTNHFNINSPVLRSDFKIKVSIIIPTIGRQKKKAMTDNSYKPTFFINDQLHVLDLPVPKGLWLPHAPSSETYPPISFFLSYIPLQQTLSNPLLK